MAQFVFDLYGRKVAGNKSIVSVAVFDLAPRRGPTPSVFL